jgi:hypothetical protein
MKKRCTRFLDRRKERYQKEKRKLLAKLVTTSTRRNLVTLLRKTIDKDITYTQKNDKKTFCNPDCKNVPFKGGKIPRKFIAQGAISYCSPLYRVSLVPR